jgi:hypothetical protein
MGTNCSCVQIQEWKEIIQRWQDSHLSLIAWSKLNNISYDKLKYWRSKLNLPNDRSIYNTILAAYPQASKIYLYVEPIYVRKGFDFLRDKITESFSEIPLGSYFVFLGRLRRNLTVFHLDFNSEIIWSKRLNCGTFLFNNRVKIWPKQSAFYILL